MAAHRWRASLPWLVLSLLSGCASASNAEWLREPEEGIVLGQRAPNFEPALSDRPPPRARLSRTVTLGETIAPAPEPSVAAVAGANPAPVNVTVNNYVTAPAPVYGGWVDRAPVRTVVPPPAAPRGGQPTPGQNWPSAPAYGPSFPFKGGPASPWR